MTVSTACTTSTRLARRYSTAAIAFGRVAAQAELPIVIGSNGKGTYIVEAVAPPGYLHQGNGDQNVVFGDSLKATTAALPFECVGHGAAGAQSSRSSLAKPNPNYAPGATWRKCDMKAVPLVPGLNAAPNFFMFTEAPVAGHGVGFILDDTATEFNYLAPNFGEKYSPPHLPVSVQDWTDREIHPRVLGPVRLLQLHPAVVVHDQPAVPVGRHAQHDGGVHEPPRADHERPGDRRPPTRHRRLIRSINRNYTTVLLHAAVPAGQDDLYRHPGAADLGLRPGDNEPAGLRVRGRHAAVSPASTTAATTDPRARDGWYVDNRSNRPTVPVVNPAFDPAVYVGATCPAPGHGS